MPSDRPQKITLSKEHRRLLTYTRLGCLCYIRLYQHTGIQYRDIKAALDLPDNIVGPQLLWLKEMKYVKSKTEKRGGEDVSVYDIEQTGEEAYNAIMAWLNSLPRFPLNEK